MTPIIRIRFDTKFALGSVEIAFGDDRAIHDESAFPGVVYPSETVLPAEDVPFTLDPPDVETLGYDDE